MKKTTGQAAGLLLLSSKIREDEAGLETTPNELTLQSSPTPWPSLPALAFDPSTRLSPLRYRIGYAPVLLHLRHRRRSHCCCRRRQSLKPPCLYYHGRL